MGEVADAGESLRWFWEATGFETLEELEEEHEAEIRDVYASLPDDSTSALGLTILALGRLRAHLNGEFSASEDHFEDPDQPPAGLPEDDELGRALASEVVRAARRTLALQPADNLAVFSLACALHWMGEHAAATAAYLQVLRLDPYDHIARARVQELGNLELPDPPSGATSGYPYGFHLLEMTHVVGHSGSTKGRVWLLNDAAAVRSAADSYLPEWLEDHGYTLDEEFGVWTHLPGHPSVGGGLMDAVGQSADGPAIDWLKVSLPSLDPHPLPLGRPIRWNGRLYFFGCTEYDDWPAAT